MDKWQNWSGRHQSELEQHAFVRSVEDASALVVECDKHSRSLRIAGSGHSHSLIVINNQVIADCTGLAGVISVDSANKQAWIRSGSAIYTLGVQLAEHGFALKNQGDIDRQTLAGAVATGTHGTGRQLQNISASVVGMKLVVASGEEVECNAATGNDLFQAARLGIGSVGFVTAINMQLCAMAVVQESSSNEAYDNLESEIPLMIANNDRFEFFWYPSNDQAMVKTINSCDGPAIYPLAKEGERQSWSHEVLPNHRPHLHTEMEYSVPQEQGLACFNEIRALLRVEFPEVRWPVEFRTVAEDDIWLSMASGRPTVTISVHQDIRVDEEPYYRACEQVFLSYGGRPHWGKVNYLDADQLARLYPHWQSWWSVRNRYDPKGTFLNDWARALNPG